MSDIGLVYSAGRGTAISASIQSEQPGRLSGMTAVVTGAARGIGRACATRFAAEGADLVLLDVASDIVGVPYPLGSEQQLHATAELCRKVGVAVLPVSADLREPRAVAAAVDRAFDRFGSADVLVNCAGIAAPSGKAVHEVGENEWQLMIDVDVSGTWRMMKAVVPSMVEQRSGSIINVASTAGLVGYRHFAGYVAAKHAVVGLTKAAALDYAPFNVRVNALCPGSVRDDPLVDGRMLREIARSLDVPLDGHEELFAVSQPMTGLIDPEAVAGAAVWLAGDDSRQVTGTVIMVDGGFTAR